MTTVVANTIVAMNIDSSLVFFIKTWFDLLHLMTCAQKLWIRIIN